MRYRLRTLLIAATIGPPLLAGFIWLAMQAIESVRQMKEADAILLHSGGEPESPYDGIYQMPRPEVEERMAREAERERLQPLPSPATTTAPAGTAREF